MYMRNKLRLMMVITFVILSMSIFYYQISINELKDFKYKISTPYNGHSKSTYYTNSYTEKDGCLEFTDDWGKKVKICGNYQIEE